MASAATLLVIGPDQVLALLRERQSEWRQRYQLQRIGLFGSMARNQATASSDVDVWVELDPLTPYATVHLKQELEELLQRPVDLVRLRERMNPALRQALERIERKDQPLLRDSAMLDREEGQDLLDVICMQFLAAGEALKRLDKLQPGLLAASFPDIDWKGAMGFRDVIAHQYFDLDAEQVLLICQQALPGVLAAIRDLEQRSQDTT